MASHWSITGSCACPSRLYSLQATYLLTWTRISYQMRMLPKPCSSVELVLRRLRALGGHSFVPHWTSATSLGCSQSPPPLAPSSWGRCFPLQSYLERDSDKLGRSNACMPPTSLDSLEVCISIQGSRNWYAAWRRQHLMLQNSFVIPSKQL